MKYLKQMGILLLFSLMGEGIRLLLPLPIPASVYGMLLLFFALVTGILKLESVRETGHFLVGIMPIMFIPAGVGLMDNVEVLMPIVVPVLFITVISLLAVFATTGWFSQLLIRKRNRRDDHE